MKKVILFGFFALNLMFSQSDDYAFVNDSIRNLDEVVIKADVMIGSKFKSKNKAGSNYFISPEELKKFGYGDVNRVLRTVPGVNLVEEEGFGLRPSIGMRGASPSRSSKITLMEDGVLIAPAPYSAPAAYYFPTMNRMQSVEILKGGSQIQYGPFTTAGAVNLVSTQIPTEFSGAINYTMGNYHTNNTYLNLGDNHANYGYLVEYNNRNSNGFKNIDFSNKHTGFDGNDYLVKFRVNTNTDAKGFQSLLFKFQKSDEVGNESYLGLTDADFRQNPNRRYLASEQDNIVTDHRQFQVTHLLIPSDNFTLTTKAYQNDFSRNWYKLHDVRVEGNMVSLVNLLSNPSTFETAYNYVTGTIDTPDNALRYRNNNRSYQARGIQSVANINWENSNTKHNLEIGIRYHEDYEDRFQWNDGYAIRNQQLIQTSSGTPGTQDNRVGFAQASAIHTLYNLNHKKWTFTPGLRYENILRYNVNYGTSDVERTGANIAYASNRNEVFIPGISILHKHNDAYSFFGGVHRGFSPAGVNEGQQPEKSINTELGLRINKGIELEVVGFFNNFSNLLGSDLAAAGGTGMGDLFNAGKAKVYGLEFLGSYQFKLPDSKSIIPITFAYTFTDTELTSNFNSGVEAWGAITQGDEIPYISKHQWSIVTGYEHPKYSFALSAKYNGQFRTLAGQGPIPNNELIKSNFIIDASAKYHLNKHVSLVCNMVNLLDETYAIARVPAGLRPGMPFGIHGGVMARF